MDSFDNICIGDINVISGVRPSSGILFIANGQACFWTNNKKKMGELLFIPKACKYKMQYTAQSTAFILIDLELLDKKR